MGVHACFARWGASRTLKHVFIYTTAAKELAAKELAPSRIRLFCKLPGQSLQSSRPARRRWGFHFADPAIFQLMWRTLNRACLKLVVAVPHEEGGGEDIRHFIFV